MEGREGRDLPLCGVCAPGTYAHLSHEDLQLWIAGNEATIRELDLKVDSMDRKLYDQRKFQEQATETYAGLSCADLQRVIAHKESIIQELERRKQDGAKVGCKRGRDQDEAEDEAQDQAQDEAQDQAKDQAEDEAQDQAQASWVVEEGMASPMMRNLLDLNHFILEGRASDAKQMERDKKEIGELADLLREGVKQSDAQMQLIKDMEKNMDNLEERYKKLKQASKNQRQAEEKVKEANNEIETLQKQIRFYRVGAQNDHMKIQWWLNSHHAMEEKMAELRGKLEMSEAKAKMSSE